MTMLKRKRSWNIKGKKKKKEKESAFIKCMRGNDKNEPLAKRKG